MEYLFLMSRIFILKIRSEKCILFVFSYTKILIVDDHELLNLTENYSNNLYPSPCNTLYVQCTQTFYIIQHATTTHIKRSSCLISHFCHTHSELNRADHHYIKQKYRQRRTPKITVARTAFQWNVN